MSGARAVRALRRDSTGSAAAAAAPAPIRPAASRPPPRPALRAKPKAEVSESARALMAANAASFESKFASIKRSAHRSKLNSALAVQRAEWQRERERLLTVRRAVETELTGGLQQALSSPSGLFVGDDAERDLRDCLSDWQVACGPIATDSAAVETLRSIRFELRRRRTVTDGVVMDAESMRRLMDSAKALMALEAERLTAAERELSAKIGPARAALLAAEAPSATAAAAAALSAAAAPTPRLSSVALSAHSPAPVAAAFAVRPASQPAHSSDEELIALPVPSEADADHTTDDSTTAGAADSKSAAALSLPSLPLPLDDSAADAGGGPTDAVWRSYSAAVHSADQRFGAELGPLRAESDALRIVLSDWPDADERASFRKVVADAGRAGWGRSQLTTALGLHFPERSAAELAARERTLTRSQYVARRLRTGLSAWTAERERLAAQLQTEWAAAEAEAERDFAAAVERLKRESAAAASHAALSAAQAEAAVKMAALREQKAAADARARVARERLEARIAVERAAQREAIASFQSDRAADRERARRERAAAAEAEEEARRTRAPLNAERVAYRQEAREAATEAKAEDAAERAAAERERIARLDALRRTVADAVDSAVARDPARAVGPTASVLAASSDPALDPVSELFPRRGYSDEQVMSDSRVRLTMALRERGLANSDYALHMIRAAMPASTPRRDARTSMQTFGTSVPPKQHEFF
jgi:hypothetical protein